MSRYLARKVAKNISDLFSKGNAERNGNKIKVHHGRGTDPTPNQSPVQITVEYGYDESVRAKNPNESIEGTWVKELHNPDHVFTQHRGEIILQYIKSSELSSVGISGGTLMPAPRGFATVTRLKKNGGRYRVVGICGNNGFDGGIPSSPMAGFILGTAYTFGTQKVPNSGPEDIRHLDHVFATVVPYSQQLKDGSYISTYRTIQMSEDTVDRLVPQTFPLRSNQLSENQLIMTQTIDKHIEKFISNAWDVNWAVEQLNMPNWNIIFSTEHNYHYIEDFLWYGRLHGAMSLYEYLLVARQEEILHTDRLIDGNTVVDALLELAFDSLVREFKEFWADCAMNTCNMMSSFNSDKNAIRERFPIQNKIDWRFDKGDPIQTLHMRTWATKTFIANDDSMRTFLQTMYLGVAQSDGPTNESFDLMIRPCSF